MSNDTPNDPFGLEALYKSIADAWNEGLEQAKRQGDCRMRRFYLMTTASATILQSGVVFPDGDVVVYNHSSKAVQVFRNLDAYTDNYRYSNVRWIDPEPQGWHFDPEDSQ